ncbi:MAG: GntR family transcriptional regulator with aminotransferase protein [Actinomycetia bacterium]|nr:GntR family transcriptional regulator with aminotransferase protein [Actinomycetes bacterium]
MKILFDQELIITERQRGSLCSIPRQAFLTTRGEFGRHLRRMRPVYRRRRDALLTALHARLPDLQAAGVAAGLHLVTWLPPDLDETAVVEAAARRGLGVYGVGPYRVSGDGPGGLIFGYATLGEPAIGEGIDLAAVIEEVRSR